MVNCMRCKKVFRDNYNLTCHQSRKNKCVDVNSLEKITLTENHTSLTENHTSLTENHTSNCIWCLALFSRKNNKIIEF